MRFAIASEGLTDHIILKNLLMGLFKDKNLPITLLRPEGKEPFGWGNLLKYIASQAFRDDCEDENIDCVIVQIDTNECEEWKKGVKHIGDNVEEINTFINSIISVLVQHIGVEFYNRNESKIIFAICVHEIECWLLPFHYNQKGQYSKITTCANAIERIANAKGYSIHQKNYKDGKYYEDLSKNMKNQKELMQKYDLNPSLHFFVDHLLQAFNPTW